MPLDIVVVMDPIGSIKIAKDSTFAMLLEAQRRGHRLHYVRPGGLSVRDGAESVQVSGIAAQMDGDDRPRLRRDAAFDVGRIEVVGARLQIGEDGHALLIDDPNDGADVGDRRGDDFIARGDADHFARLVDNAVIADNDYNLSVSSYVEERDDRVAVDIVELNAEIARIVARQQELRTAIDEIVADLESSDR